MIRFVTKQMFFDRKAVTGAVEKAARKVLSRFGAFVRRGAKSSIRKRKRISAPGEQPSSHTGLLKRFIFFGYDRSNRSVVIGPERLNQNRRGEAPHLLEYGGAGAVERRGRRRRMNVRARPFMGPAFQKEQPKLPAMWANSLR